MFFLNVTAEKDTEKMTYHKPGIKHSEMSGHLEGKVVDYFDGLKHPHL